MKGNAELSFELFQFNIWISIMMKIYPTKEIVFINSNRKFAFDSSTGYIYCCAGLGDTLLTCGFLRILEKKYGFHMCLILKRTHIVVAKMYEITDFFILDVDIDMSEIKRNTAKTPQTGKVFFAHPFAHPELLCAPVRMATVKFLPWFRSFFNIDKSERFLFPKIYPELEPDLRDRCNRVAPLSEIVIFNPEATSMPNLPNYFWERKVKLLKKKGLTVISNVINPANTISWTKYMDLTITEIISLALRCHSFYAMRSGICDLIFSMGKRLHVFYPSHSDFFFYSLNDMFELNEIDEKIVLL
jgi:hypothetical protein